MAGTDGAVGKAARPCPASTRRLGRAHPRAAGLRCGLVRHRLAGRCRPAGTPARFPHAASRGQRHGSGQAACPPVRDGCAGAHGRGHGKRACRHFGRHVPGSRRRVPPGLVGSGRPALARPALGRRVDRPGRGRRRVRGAVRGVAARERGRDRGSGSRRGTGRGPRGAGAVPGCPLAGRGRSGHRPRPVRLPCGPNGGPTGRGACQCPASALLVADGGGRGSFEGTVLPTGEARPVASTEDLPPSMPAPGRAARPRQPPAGVRRRGGRTVRRASASPPLTTSECR